MTDLFQPARVAGLSLRNRLMRSATAERRSRPDGTPRPELAAFLGQLASGGVGLVVVGHTFVASEGKAGHGMSGLWRDDQVPAFAAVAEAVKARGAAIAVQINHAGGAADPAITGYEALAPSAVPPRPGLPAPRALIEREIEALVQAFGQAARRARQAGFDAVQIHGAHGYLTSQFLSPSTNRRDDRWGGSLANRARFLREVADCVRQHVGPHYPVMVKLGLADDAPEGLSLEDGLSVVEMLAEMGIDMLEISAGISSTAAATDVREEEQEAYFLPWARRARERTSLPIALVGGFRSLSVMQRVLAEGAADIISLSRPLIREPDLPGKLAGGMAAKASCISCNLCMNRRESPTRCWVE